MHTQIDTNLVNEPNFLLRHNAIAKSGVSWGAIIAGATAAAALSLILLILGTGLGLGAISPWAQDGISAEAFGVSTIAWITFVSIAASALGGYIAGRLRTKWLGIRTDEVYFRDTAHGFLAWCVATLVTATLLTSAVGMLVGGTVSAGSKMAGGATTMAAMANSDDSKDASSMSGNNNPIDYFIDSLFRRGGNGMQTMANANQMPSDSTLANTPAETTAEVTRIFGYALWNEQDLTAEDVTYVGQLITQRTELNQQQAEQRVKETYSRLQKKLEEMIASAKEAADKAREFSAYSSLWLFLSLLIGAFVASLAATFGGRQRDF